MDIFILLVALFLLFKGKMAWVLFSIILLTTSYLGTGTNISEFPIEHNVSDSGLILFIALCFYLINKNKFKILETKLSIYLIIFYSFLFISFCIDLLINDVDIIDIIKTSRHWIFLAGIWVFNYISHFDIKKLIMYLFKATIFISLIMLFEFFSKIKIFGMEYETLVSDSGEYLTRGSIPSTFVPFFILLLFTPYLNLKPKFKYFYIVILSMVLITSVIRSWFIAVIVGIFIILIFQNKLKLKKVISGIIIIIGLFFAVSINPTIRDRFNDGLEEVTNFNFANENEVRGNYSFRILHMKERLNFVFQSYQYIFFGIGNITEDNFPEIFRVGLLEENSGKVIQLDTGDIAWSVFFLRLGFLGTAIYLFIYLNLLNSFYKIRKHSSLALTTFVYLLINIMVLSFASAIIATGHFFIFPFLVYFLLKRENLIARSYKRSNKLLLVNNE